MACQRCWRIPLTYVVELRQRSDAVPHIPVEKRVVAKRRNVIAIEQQLGYEPGSNEKDNMMTSATTFRTPYEIRLELVADTIKAHSKLGNEAASGLAVHVLHALNSIPEKMR